MKIASSLVGIIAENIKSHFVDFAGTLLENSKVESIIVVLLHHKCLGKSSNRVARRWLHCQVYLCVVGKLHKLEPLGWNKSLHMKVTVVDDLHALYLSLHADHSCLAY